MASSARVGPYRAWPTLARFSSVAHLPRATLHDHTNADVNRPQRCGRVDGHTSVLLLAITLQKAAGRARAVPLSSS